MFDSLQQKNKDLNSSLHEGRNFSDEVGFEPDLENSREQLGIMPLSHD